MPLFLLSFLGFVKALFSKAWTWLGTLSFWQLVAGGLAIFAVVQHFQIISARHETAKWQKQDAAHVAQLQAISSKRNEQQVVTRDKLKIVERIVKSGDDRAKVVEAAPPAPDCKTKPEVLGADL